MDRAQELAWLQSLKVDDEVAVGRGSEVSIYKITRATKTHVTVHNTQYSRKNGKAAGTSGFRVNYIHPVTEEARATAERNQIVGAIRVFANYDDLSKFPIGLLRNIRNIIREGRAEVTREEIDRG